MALLFKARILFMISLDRPELLEMLPLASFSMALTLFFEFRKMPYMLSTSSFSIKRGFMTLKTSDGVLRISPFGGI